MKIGIYYRETGFTLIELLVVITIMAILSSMIFISREKSELQDITADAYELQSVMQRARSLAMATSKVHAVTFHIENAGDGTVFKNESIHDSEDESFIGRHWYAIIGPAAVVRSTGGNLSSALEEHLPPLLKPGYLGKTYHTITDYAKAVESAQIGPRHYLTRGVRFLALSDVDTLKIDPIDVGKDTTYPRPWFGYYDAASKTLYPWGAYNKDIDALLTFPNTGLDYQGMDEPAVYDPVLDTMVSPAKVWGRINFIWDYSAHTGSGATAMEIADLSTNDPAIKKRYGYIHKFVGPDTSVLANKVRPVVNGHWSDFMILFNANGSAMMTNGHARVSHLTPKGTYNSSPIRMEGRAHMGIGSEVDRTGGFSITLARDIDVDKDEDLYLQMDALTGQPAFNKFERVEDAFESITPFLRVYVNKFNGISTVRNNAHPNLKIVASDLEQHDPFPRGTN